VAGTLSTFVSAITDTRILQPPRQSPVALLALAAAVLFAVAIVAGATYLDRVLYVLAGAVGLGLVLVGLRWPMIPLLLYVAAIPFDDVVRLGDFGSLGRTAAIVFAVAYVLPRIRRLRLGAMPLAGWVYLGWATLSIGWALDADTSIREIGTLIQLFIIGLLVADFVIDQPGRVRLIMWIYTVSAAASGVIGILGYLSGQLIEGQRAAALMGQNPAQFGALLLPAFLFGLHEFLAGRLKLVSIGVAMVTGVAIVLSGTRGVWLGGLVAVAIFVIPRLPRVQKVLACALLAAMMILVFQIPGVGDFVSERTGNAISTGGAGRTSIWQVGLGIIESSPIVGSGHANFPIAYTPEMIRSTLPYDVSDTGRAPHNVVIGVLGELGVVGLVLVALFLGPLLLRAGWGPYGAILQAILVSLMVTALFLDVLDNRKQVWLIIGLAAGLTYLRQHPELLPSRDRQEPFAAGTTLARESG
jgi:O-antigen ligase